MLNRCLGFAAVVGGVVGHTGILECLDILDQGVGGGAGHILEHPTDNSIVVNRAPAPESGAAGQPVKVGEKGKAKCRGFID